MLQLISKIMYGLYFMIVHPIIFFYGRKCEDVDDLATLPIGKLLNVMVHKKELNSWNTIAAMIDYTFPTEKLALYKNDESIKLELRYCMKYAAYIYFMNIIGNPLSIKIAADDKYLPFSVDINKTGYFIGIDDNPNNDKNKVKCILLCIRGTSTIGECITDLCAHSVEKEFGEQKYNVHHGIYETAKWIDGKVRNKIIEYSEKFPEHKILITGHSLGAGVCSLLGLLWKAQHVFDDKNVSYYSFASPLIVDGNGRRESMKNNMISVAVATDIVTRLSIKGVLNMNERMKIIQDLDNSDGIINNIVKMRCGSNNIEEFHNKLSKEESELIVKLRRLKKINNIGIPESITDDRKEDNNNVETDDDFLYPCGKLLWFVPEFLMDNNINTEDKYTLLRNLINWQIEPNALIQGLQFINNIIRDFYKYNDNVILTTPKSEDSAQPFTQMVYNGDESFDAHFPGRYLHCFNLSLSDIFEMSSKYHKLKAVWPIPQFLLTWLISIIFILNYLIKTTIRYFRNLFCNKKNCNQQKHRH